MFELSGVRVIEWFLWESISEGSTRIQKQFELLEVRVIRGSSYRECTVIETECEIVISNDVTINWKVHAAEIMETILGIQ